MTRILLVCGSGIITSTVVRKKLEEELNNKGYKGNFTITQGRIADIQTQSENFDVVVSTTAVNVESKCPVVIATGLLTNQETESIYKEIESFMK